MNPHDDSSRAASPTIRPSRSHSPDFQPGQEKNELKSAQTGEDAIEYPEGLKLFLITIALCLSVFLVALVRVPYYSPIKCSTHTPL
jgi:hypothetical protein